MIFCTLKTEYSGDVFEHRVTLCEGAKLKQVAVVASGLAPEVALRLCQDLNQSLCNADLAHQKNQPANDSLGDLSVRQLKARINQLDGLKHIADMYARRWRRLAYFGLSMVIFVTVVLPALHLK